MANRSTFRVTLGLLAALACAPAAAATCYWDTNGAAVGFGTATGTWGTDAFWSTNSAGTSSPTSPTTTSADTVNFGFPTTGTTNSLSSGTININGVQAAGTFATAGTGALTFSGGTLNVTNMNFGATGGATFGSALNIPAGTTTTVNESNGSGNVVLNGALFGSGRLNIANSSAGSYFWVQNDFTDFTGTLEIASGASGNIYNGVNAGGIQGWGDIVFQSGLAANPTLKIRGSAGGSSRANLNIGTGESGTSYVGINGELDLVDGTNGTRVDCQLDALIGTMLVGQTYYGGGGITTGGFVMGDGTLDATTIVVGQRTGTDFTGGYVDGSVNVDGGEMLAATLTLGDKQNNTGTVYAAFALNGGTLSAGMLQSGANAATRIFDWNDGTTANYNGSAGTTNLTVGIPSLTLANTGTHTFWIDAGQIGTVSSAIGESSPGGSPVKNGGGTLVLTGTNSYSGETTVADGTLTAMNPAALASGSNLTVGNAALFASMIPDLTASGITPSSVPEPSSLALLTIGVCGAAVYQRLCLRRKKQ